MSRQLVDRSLADWLRGQEATPAYLDEIVARTQHARQRPRWSFPHTWLPMPGTAGPADVPHAASLLLTAALLLALLGAAVLLIGSRRDDAPPFGLAANGAILLDVDGQLWQTESDGSNPRAVELGLGRAFSPVFSPDGTKISFFTQAAPRTPISLFVADADGSEPRNVTGDMTIVTQEVRGVSWSPDSSRIAFSSFDSARGRLYVAAADGSGVRAITARDRDRTYPVWSPDGVWLAYLLDRWDADPSSTHLAVARPDGSGERVLRSARSFYLGVDWSLDSTRISYVRTEGTGWIAGTVDLGGNEQIVAEVDKRSSVPAWSPDGSRLAYATASAIVVTDLDGDPRITIPTPAASCGVGWAPDATALLVGSDCRGEWQVATSLYRIPIDAPESATRLQVPAGSVNTATWQRRAP